MKKIDYNLILKSLDIKTHKKKLLDKSYDLLYKELDADIIKMYFDDYYVKLKYPNKLTIKGKNKTRFYDYIDDLSDIVKIN